MAQNNENIIGHWSFLAFAQEFGSVINMQEWTPEEGTPFKTLSFRESEDTTDAKFVHFSSKLGELSEDQLGSMWRDLQVIELKVDEETLARRAEKGHQLESYILCKKGELNYGQRININFN